MAHKGLRRVAAFAAAVGAMVLLGTTAHSVFVQQAWIVAAGQADGTGHAIIPLTERLDWIAHDLVGMFRAYAASTSIALLIAFLTAGALARFTGLRMAVFGFAGAAAIWALFTALRFFLGSVGVFGARGALGLMAQMAAGCIAGLLFARLTTAREPQAPNS